MSFCLRCKTAPARIFCYECGPAFTSLSSWGYFKTVPTFARSGDNKQVPQCPPSSELGAYGMHANPFKTWYPGDTIPMPPPWANPHVWFEDEMWRDHQSIQGALSGKVLSATRTERAGA